MEVRADPGHQRPAGRPPPRQVAVAGIKANAGEQAMQRCASARTPPHCDKGSMVPASPLVARRPGGAPQRRDGLKWAHP